MKTLVIANRKGGVGKTTLTAHLAYAAEGENLRVLLVDMDGQGSLSASFPSTYGPGGTLTASKLYGKSVDGLNVEVLNAHLSIVRADDSMAYEVSGDDDVGVPDEAPRKALAALAASYDLCLIDTPPGLGMHLKAALVAADFVVTPVSMGLYETMGLQKLIATITDARKTARQNGRSLTYIGILPTKVNTRRQSEVKQLANLKTSVGAGMLETHLPERAAVRNAVEARQPVWQNIRGASHAKAAAEWRAACAAILTKVMK